MPIDRNDPEVLAALEVLILELLTDARKPDDSTPPTTTKDRAPVRRVR